MNSSYRVGHRTKQRKRRLGLSVFVSLLLIGGIAGFVVRDLKKNNQVAVESTGRTVTQVLGDTDQRINVDMPTFTMELPGDWKQSDSRKNSIENSTTWKATKKGEDNRYLTAYVDLIPADRAVNRLLPVTAVGNLVNYGDLSDKCETFTGGSTTNAEKSTHLKATISRWRNVDFMCNLPNIVENETGTGSPEGVNKITITGQDKGKHTYFFVYTDRNIKPDYTILYDALKSFRAK